MTPTWSYVRFAIGYHTRLHATNLAVRITPRPTVYFGSDWGGWSVMEQLLDPESVVYSAGIGSDATFDVGLIARVGCVVHAFDPTPAGRAEGERLARDEPRFRYHDVGLWNDDTTIRFHVPAPGFESFSILNLQHTAETVSLPVRRLGSLMREFGHDHVDLLKIDIEGAEHAVLDDLISNRLDVRQLCVEFDQPMPLVKILALIRRLRGSGYMPVQRRLWDYTFVRDQS